MRWTIWSTAIGSTSDRLQDSVPVSWIPLWSDIDSLCVYAGIHPVVGRRSVHVHSEAVHVLVHETASGSARECGAILDILGRCGVLDADALGVGKGLIVRIVAMLTRMIDRGHGGVREEGIVYGNENVNVNDEDTGQPDG
jgi:hypothetical protein